MISPELAAAAAQSEAALAAGQGDGYDCMVVALHRSASGDPAAADALFEQAARLSPDDPSVLTGFAKFLREQGRLKEGVAAADRAVQLAPDYPDAWIERAAILGAGGSQRAALESYRRALTLNPQAATAHAGIAAITAREGEAEQARTHAQIALQLDPANAVAASALAALELEAGNPQAVIDLLAPLLAVQPEPSFDRSLMAGFLGDALGKLGQHDDAYAAYARCKADFAAIHAASASGRMRHREFVEAIRDGLAAMPISPAEALPSATGEAANHVFLLGYPRSGTTLLENVLASLPGAEALEERPTLDAADKALLSGNAPEIAAALGQFAALPAADLQCFRQAYWDKVVQSGITAGARLFVDMDPLKGTRLPLIARLFPKAKVLLLRRDPRDVVWSCFRTQFAMTSGTLDFTSLQSTARHYDALMQLTELARERLPFDLLEVHYHRLVTDFDATTREICAFLGVSWSEDMRRFDRTAQARGVATASVGQVRKGLYDGRGQWQPYACYLEPVMPLLQPWIERFGYA